MLESFQKLLLIGFIIEFTFVGAEETQLRSVSVLFRHGDRTPRMNELRFIGSYLNHSFYPEGYEQLTNQGKNRAFRLGQYLRARYNDLLGPIYTSSILYARSTSYERAKSSLQLVLAGLFPPVAMQKWNENLEWQPIPFDFNNKYDDSLLMGHECQRFRDEEKKVQVSPEFLEKQSQVLGSFFRYFKNVTRSNMEHAVQLSNVYSGLATLSNMNLTLPNWTDGFFPKGALYDAMLLYLQTSGFNDRLRRLNGGQLVRKISEDMMNERNGTFEECRKIYLYSAHDYTIAGLLLALKIPVTEVPYFSSAIMIELRKNKNNEYFVQLFYRAEDQERILELQLPDCDKLCPLDTFLKQTRNVWPSNEELICQPAM